MLQDENYCFNSDITESQCGDDLTWCSCNRDTSDTQLMTQLRKETKHLQILFRYRFICYTIKLLFVLNKRLEPVAQSISSTIKQLSWYLLRLIHNTHYCDKWHKEIFCHQGECNWSRGACCRCCGCSFGRCCCLL